MIKALTPAALPLSLPELKTLLRIEHDLEDALLATLLRTATDAAEDFLGTVLLVRGFEQSWTNCPGIPLRLHRRPVGAITQITVGGQVLTADRYQLITGVFDDSDVTILDPGEGRVVVTFTAGTAASWNDIAEPLRFGILRLAAHLYANRDATNAPALPSAVQALWQPYRKVRLT